MVVPHCELLNFQFTNNHQNKININKLIIFLFLFYFALAGFSQTMAPPSIASITNGKVSAKWQGQKATLKPGDTIGPWTLMSVLSDSKPLPVAVFENFNERNGQMVLVNKTGIRHTFDKSLEATFPTDSFRLYNGHTLKEVMDNPVDILGKEVLSKKGDPSYEQVAPLISPLRILGVRTYSFLGTRNNYDKVPFFYGGVTPTFYPAMFMPEINEVIKSHKVLDGLVGGWLPALRFVYPQPNNDWVEMVAFAPFRMENANKWMQPVWYRLSRVSNGKLAEVKYFDSYIPYAPRTTASSTDFYKDFIGFQDGWNKELNGSMQLSVPEKRITDMSRYSLSRVLMTRNELSPKYGAVEEQYGHTQHDGFQDTFNAEVLAMLEWGMPDMAKAYIVNYLEQWVRDDGSLLYRGAEIGQYGRMLTNIAQYAAYTGDYNLLLKYRVRINAITKLLLSLRKQALQLDSNDPRHGLVPGFSEADACLFFGEPKRYEVPYFGNSTEVARGLRDLGLAWQKSSDLEQQKWGRGLVEQSKALEKDLQLSIKRSILTQTTPPCIPPIAGGKPFDMALANDDNAPEKYADRSYVEMLFSGNITREQVKMILDYRATHNDMILGMPSIISRDFSSKSKVLDGYILYMHAYGLLQHDFVREYLLLLNGMIAHHYTRGSWTATECRNIDPNRGSNPYATPAQLVVPLMARWLLVFEDPHSGDLWLAKAAPRDWFADGQHFWVKDAPTRHGRIGFSVASSLNNGIIEATLELPNKPVSSQIYVRLRVPEGHKLKAVTVDGKPYMNFSPANETITFAVGASGKKKIVAEYSE